MLKAWGAIFSDFTGKKGVRRWTRKPSASSSPKKNGAAPGQKEKSFLAQISKSGNHLIAVSDGFSP